MKNLFTKCNSQRIAFFLIMLVILVIACLAYMYNYYFSSDANNIVDSREDFWLVENSSLGRAALEYPDQDAIQPLKKKAKLALIIDDFGNNGEGTLEMMTIDRPMTFAVLPFMKYTQRDAVNAHENGHEVLIHMPMETSRGKSGGLGNGAIRTSQTSEEIKSLVQTAIKDVPYAIGANNHMGVIASSDDRVVTALISVLKEHGLFIIDSKTTPKSVIYKVAEKQDLFVIEMSLFIDNEKDKELIKDNLRKLSEIAMKRGYAVGIGHVGPLGGYETAHAIKEMIPELEANNIIFTPVSELIRDKYK